MAGLIVPLLRLLTNPGASYTIHSKPVMEVFVLPSVKVRYTVQSCPKCGKKLLEQQAGKKEIGSPLITCKTCNITYTTDLRVEWYQYEPKWPVLYMPLVIPAIALVACTIFGQPGIGLVIALIALGYSLLFGGKDWLRILESKKRMQNRSYLQQLLQHNVISQEEYRRLIKQIKN